ncbi:MAG: hypothetical protein IIX06_00530 [Bacteroidales bacterium]|nr:hypothetical protein [Bacteroidales bacterium]
MKIIKNLFLSTLTIVFSAILMTSCHPFEGNQEIPAYLHVDKFLLTTNYYAEGAASHKITDVAVYIDDSYQGYYELPATIPILERGKHKLTLYPGIKLNGNSSTRTINPFYVPYTIEDYVFEEKVIDTVTPSTQYLPIDESDINFVWMEDFERQVNFETVAYSDTTITRTDRDAPDVWKDREGNSHYSGYVWIEDTLTFCITTPKLYDLPNQGNSIFLELDYKCTEMFSVGLFAKIASEEKIELVHVNPSAEWNKIYINLGPNITNTSSSNPEYFRVYISGATEKNTEAKYFFDNIKIVYRD